MIAPILHAVCTAIVWILYLHLKLRIACQTPEKLVSVYSISVQLLAAFDSTPRFTLIYHYGLGVHDRTKWSFWNPALHMMLYGWRTRGISPGTSLAVGMALNLGLAIVPITVALRLRASL